ncbi:hypothetical protein [Pseudactinotalea sp.]|uniref:hypothetical protein n=1 Tax=Pseudactinotalea sp. TaxID=1926260 RepID=UPI003B3BBB5B
MTLTQPAAIASRTAGRRPAWRTAAVGAVCGLAWAGALRAVMAELAQPSRVAWSGTFAGVLIPGAVTGALLAVASARGAEDRTEHMRWFTLAPLAFVVGIVVQPGFFASLRGDGLGVGGLAFPALMIIGGFAVGGRGWGWLRAIGGVLAAAFVVALVVSLPMIAGPALALTEPRGAWVASLAASLTVLAVLAASIPFRHARRPGA